MSTFIRLCAAVAIAVAVAGCGAYQPPPEPDPVVPAGTPDPGRSIFQQTCAGCHGPAARGTPRAPALTDVGSASVDFQLSTGRMPLNVDEPYRAEHQPAKLSAAEIDAVVGYVSTLQRGGPDIPDVVPTGVERGRALYAQNCAACHSPGAVGGLLTGGMSAPDLRKATPTQIGEAIRVGPNLMPAYPESVLTPTDVNNIAAYVESLSDQPRGLDHGGVSLGRTGPVTEGLLAMFVGLPLLLIVCRRLGSRGS